ncbi:MAG: type II secretion system F family protein [Syntrophobacterales bacterium]|jgi:type IV pilus assembly protein PilC|nr:type II secretion system F family protein [Syntrophobacterales bacterium]
MPVFLWEGLNRKNEHKKGELDGVDDAAVRSQLRRMGYHDVKVKTKPKDLLDLPFLRPGIKEENVVVFARIFSTMISAGLPLIQCLNLLAEQEKNKSFAKVIYTIKEDIEGGSTLFDALKKHPAVFDDLFVSLVAAGESGGILDVVLQRLSVYKEKALKLKRKVKAAMTYPLTVVVIAVIVVAVLLVKVIPTFKTMFEGAGGQLPLPTQVVISISEFTQANILYIIIAIVVFIFALRQFYKTKKGRYIIDDFTLRVAVFGPLMRKVAVAKFSRTLATMLSAGVPILEGLGIVSKVAGNVIIENALLKTRQSISEGRSIAEPLQESGVFPPMVVQMIAVGEATGAIDTMLTKIADFYDDEVDAAVSSLTALLEPIMMAFLGIVVGGMLIAMYLPIFKLASVVS